MGVGKLVFFFFFWSVLLEIHSPWGQDHDFFFKNSDNDYLLRTNAINNLSFELSHFSMPITNTLVF